MKMISKIFRGLNFCAMTLVAKLQYGDKLKVDEVFRKRHDTQTIRADNGKTGW